MSTTPPTEISSIESVIPHFTSSAAWKDPSVPVLARGEGAWVDDIHGTRYLDGLSGLFCTNLGHGRTDLVAAATDQMSKLAFVPSWGATHDVAVQAADAITARAPGGMDRLFSVSSGSEAVESAVKLARSYHLANGEPGRYKMISRDFSYHGTTLGALSVTAVPRFREPFAPLLNDASRNVPNTLRDSPAPGGGPGDLSGVQAIEDLILAEGPETVAAVFAEPVQNGGGAIVPPAGYWAALRVVCDRYGVLLVADEVITGFGRIGHWFASELFGVVPDLLTFAKGATSAYIPYGGVITHSWLTDTIANSELGWFAHGSTFGAHPVASAVSLATIDAMEKDQVLENVRQRQGGLLEGLQAVAAGSPFIREVRGAGFFYALEVVGDRDSGTGLTPEQRAGLLGGVLVKAMRDARLLIRPDDRGPVSIVVAPPLISDADVLGELLARLDQVVTTASDWLRANG